MKFFTKEEVEEIKKLNPDFNPNKLPRGSRTGNPNIKNLRKPGPITFAGKLKNSVHAVKFKGAGLRRNQNGISMVSNLAKCSLCPIKDTCPYFDPEDKGCLVRYNAMVDWVKKTNMKDLTEVRELEDMYMRLRGDLEVEELIALSKGKSYNERIMLKMRLGKEMLQDMHKMKHGSKLEIKNYISFEDIRKKFMQIKIEDKDGNFLKQIEVVKDEVSEGRNNTRRRNQN